VGKTFEACSPERMPFHGNPGGLDHDRAYVPPSLFSDTLATVGLTTIVDPGP
jgi:hypothetical protein